MKRTTKSASRAMELINAQMTGRAIEPGFLQEEQLYQNNDNLFASSRLLPWLIAEPVPTGKKKVPGLVTRPTTEWLEQGDEATPADPVYTSKTLENKRLLSMVNVSNDAFRYSDMSPTLDADIRSALGFEFDRAAILGDNGTNPEEPDGIIAQLDAGQQHVSTNNFGQDVAALVSLCAVAGIDVSEGIIVAPPSSIASEYGDAWPYATFQTDLGGSQLVAVIYPIVPVYALEASKRLLFIAGNSVVVSDPTAEIRIDQNGLGFNQDFSQVRAITHTDVAVRNDKAAAWSTITY